jgi:hypothetical protein
MSKCNVCGKEMRAGTEHVRPDLATVCSSCAKRPFDYQQWRTASVVTPKMLDSCLDRIAELEAENTHLSSLCDRLTAVNQSRVNDEAVALKRAEQAEARCKELAEETADRIGALLKAEAALAEEREIRDAYVLKAEAALAERDARRCIDCAKFTYMECPVWPAFHRGETVESLPPDYSCSLWTIRAEEGSK